MPYAGFTGLCGYNGVIHDFQIWTLASRFPETEAVCIITNLKSLTSISGKPSPCKVLHFAKTGNLEKTILFLRAGRLPSNADTVLVCPKKKEPDLDLVYRGIKDAYNL